MNLAECESINISIESFVSHEQKLIHQSKFLNCNGKLTVRHNLTTKIAIRIEILNDKISIVKALIISVL